MKIIKGCIIFLFGIGTAFATIYKWTDSQGTVHYSDMPAPGAKTIDLPGFQISAPPPAPVQNGKEGEESKGNSSYDKLAITQPPDKATIRNPQGYLLVSAEVNPALQNGDKMQMIIDGNPFGKPQASPGFALNGLERGSHKISVQIVDVNGKSIMTSDPVEVFMMPPRVNMTPASSKPNASGGKQNP